MRFHRVALTAALAFGCALSLYAQDAKPTLTLTAEERQKAVQEFEKTKANFLNSISGLSEKQWNFKPAPDRWSIAEVSEHIALSEQGIAGMVREKVMKAPAAPDSRSQTQGKDDMILQKLVDRSVKAKAPEFLQPTHKWATQAELMRAFEESRAANIEYVKSTQEDLRDHAAPHPVFGPLDAYQWMLLISAHSARHTAQIEEVKADPNFPKS